MIEETKNTLGRMKFHGMLATLDIRLAEATSHGWGHGEFPSALITDEKTYRDNQATSRRIKGAQFRTEASFEHFDFTAKRSIGRTQIQDLMELRFLRDPRNVLILGPTGVGKTFLATAIGNHVCRSGFSCLFVGVNLLIEKITLARADGTFMKYRDRLAKADILILDDLGIKTLPAETVQDLYDILEERFIPHLRDHVDVFAIGSPATNERFVRAPLGNAYGAALIPAHVRASRKPMKTPVENLWLCNATAGWPSIGGTVGTGRRLAHRLIAGQD